MAVCMDFILHFVNLSVPDLIMVKFYFVCIYIFITRV